MKEDYSLSEAQIEPLDHKNDNECHVSSEPKHLLKVERMNAIYEVHTHTSVINL